MVHVATQYVEAIGYLGGALLAGCFIPQVFKVIQSRSVHDISILWSLLYSAGLTLTMVYLIYKDAPAAWIPSLFELIGALLVLALKLLLDHTAIGQRMCAATQQQHHEHQQQQQQQQQLHELPGGESLRVPLSRRGSILASYSPSAFGSLLPTLSGRAVLDNADVLVDIHPVHPLGKYLQPAGHKRADDSVLLRVAGHRLPALEQLALGMGGNRAATSPGAMTQHAVGPRSSGRPLWTGSKSDAGTHGFLPLPSAEPS